MQTIQTVAVTRPDMDQSPSLAVVETIAAEEGVDPATLTPRLGEIIDPEALDRLLAANGECSVSFQYREYTVSVDAQDVSLQVAA